MNLKVDIRKIKVEELKTIDLDTVDISLEAPDFEPQRQYYFMAECREYVRAESRRSGRPLFCVAVTFGGQMKTMWIDGLPGAGLRECKP